MRLELSEDDRAFREEMRTFFTTQVPEEIRRTVIEGGELSKEHIVDSMRVLNDAGLAVPHWPEEWGGRGWSELRRHIWYDEMQRAGCPPPQARKTSKSLCSETTAGCPAGSSRPLTTSPLSRTPRARPERPRAP